MPPQGKDIVLFGPALHLGNPLDAAEETALQAIDLLLDENDQIVTCHCYHLVIYTVQGRRRISY